MIWTGTGYIYISDESHPDIYQYCNVDSLETQEIRFLEYSKVHCMESVIQQAALYKDSVTALNEAASQLNKFPELHPRIHWIHES